MPSSVEPADVIVVGGGAAGLATAIFCARALNGSGRVLCLDGARSVGAKILVSGGARCNVTNRVVTERDFWGGEARFVRRVLRAFPAERAARFFEELGVSLHEEEDGKLFPDTHRARSILNALVDELTRAGAELLTLRRVVAVTDEAGRFKVETADGSAFLARIVVLATGGRSLPKTGSDGLGYALARGLGHSYVETTPALAPLLLGDAFHHRLAGISHSAEITVRTADRLVARLRGDMLWTHFGASGPLILNASRHWLRARLDGTPPTATLSVLPGETFESTEAWIHDQTRVRPRALVRTILASRLPAAMAAVWLEQSGVEEGTTLAHLDRDDRRRLLRTLLAMPLQVLDSRGYNYAEVTAGGIPLTEIDPATMESRVRPGLYLTGEILDVDGRLGGFNFQWAWSSAWVAAQAIARILKS